MIHESGRWSDAHKRWFFFPRKLSRRPYDEVADEKKCCNLFLSVGEDFAEESVLLRTMVLDDAAGTTAGTGTAAVSSVDSDDDLLNRGLLPLRGCSDFFFVPGSADCHLFVLRTEETIAGDVESFASVVDLSGAVLLPEARVGAAGRKFEGVCCLGDGGVPE